jgi:hypothetical protein
VRQRAVPQAAGFLNVCVSARWISEPVDRLP